MKTLSAPAMDRRHVVELAAGGVVAGVGNVIVRRIRETHGRRWSVVASVGLGLVMFLIEEVFKAPPYYNVNVSIKATLPKVRGHAYTYVYGREKCIACSKQANNKIEGVGPVCINHFIEYSWDRWTPAGTSV